MNANDGVLFCFMSAAHLRDIMSCLDFTLLRDGQISTWSGGHAPLMVVDATVVQNGNDVQRLCSFYTSVVVFSSQVFPHTIRVCQLNDLRQTAVCGGWVIPADKLEKLRQVFQTFAPLAQERQQQEEYANDAFEALQQGRVLPMHVHFHNPTVFMTPHGSMTVVEEEEEEQSTPKSWQDILKPQGEPTEPGDAVCITCAKMKATVCFVPCGHQVMCDTCVRHMWSLRNVNKVCPICRQAVLQITRPIVSTQ